MGQQSALLLMNVGKSAVCSLAGFMENFRPIYYRRGRLSSRLPIIFPAVNVGFFFCSSMLRTSLISCRIGKKGVSLDNHRLLRKTHLPET
jgi:hypothetical protein